jgi:hypothetical protein
MKLAAWNVNSLKVRLDQVLDWLALHRPDALRLQETKLEDDSFPAEAFRDAGWQVAWSGQKTYNGVAIVSPHAIHDIQAGIPGLADEQKRLIAGTVDGVRVVCADVPNGQAVGSDKYAYKLGWLQALHDWLAGEVAAHPLLASRRLQHRAGRPRCARPGAVGRAGAVLGAGAGRLPPSAGARPGRQLPSVRAATRHLLLVGLPSGRLPSQPRPAHRPCPAEPGACSALHGGRHRRCAAPP